MRTKHLFVLINTRTDSENSSVKYFKPSSDFVADCSKAVLLLSIIFVIMFHVYLCFAALSVPYSLMVTCLERADLLALLCGGFSSLFNMVFHVRCGT